MSAFLLIASAITLMVLFRDRNKEEIAYSGSEFNLREANQYYWVLKNHRIPVKYVIPYNWENFYRFGYKPCSVYIKVNKRDMEKANKIMMDFRIERRKMEENAAMNRNQQ